MADTSGVITLKDLVKRVLLKADLGQDKYWKFYQLAIDGYRELRLFDGSEGLNYSKQTVISATNSINFPSDCIKVVDVSVPIDGELWPLMKENKIVPTTSSGTLDPDWGEGEDLKRLRSYSYQTRGVSTEGYYTVNYHDRTIILRNTTATQVFLLYKSSGTEVGDTTNVPIQYYPQIEAYVMKESTAYTNPALSAQFEVKYNNERDRVRWLANVDSAEQIRNWFYKLYTQMPTR